MATQRKTGKKKKVKAEHDKPEASYLKPKEEHTDGNLKELAAEKEQPTMQKVMELRGILNNWEDTIERYKESIAVTSFTLALIDDRSLSSLSSCMAYIRKANDSLKEEMELEFANLESPAPTKVNKEQEAKTAQDVKKVKNTGVQICRIHSTEKLEDGTNQVNISSIAELSDGDMVISGPAPNKKSYITVINSKGKIQHTHMMEGRPQVDTTNRYCCNFSEEKVLTVYGTQEVAFFDISKDKKGIRSSAPCKPSNTTRQIDWKMTCVAYNPWKQEVIVCYGHAAGLSIYNNELKCQFTEPLKHPNIEKVNDIAVHPRFLLVCHSKGANTFTIKEQKIITGFELEKPKDSNSAISVCVSKKSFIYMLWLDGKKQTLLAKYNQDGKKQTDEKSLKDVKNGCLTTLDVGGTERLVIASNDPRTLYSYQLEEDE